MFTSFSSRSDPVQAIRDGSTGHVNNEFDVKLKRKLRNWLPKEVFISFVLILFIHQGLALNFRICQICVDNIRLM